MTEPTSPIPRSRLRLGLSWLAATGLLGVVTIIVLLQLLLATPLATRRTTTFLGQTLQRSVQLDGLRLTLAGVELQGLRIANTPGLPEPWLLQVARATVAPDWRQLLQGRRVVTVVRIGSPRLHLARTARGTWNLNELLRPLQAAKKPGPELVIGRLLISDGTILFPGGALQALELAATDLATKGSRPLAFTLKTHGPQGITGTATGTARLGSQPTADVTLMATAPLAHLAPQHGQLGLDQGIATGTAKLALAAGQLAYTATGTVSGAVWRTSAAARPLPLKLHLQGNYDLAQDLLLLTTARVDLAPLTLLATGRVAGLKKEQRFTADLALAPQDFGPLLPFLPRAPALQLRGQLNTAQLRLAGSQSGLTAAAGTIALQDIGISRSGAHLIADTRADARLTLTRDGWQLAGAITQPLQPEPLVQSLDLPFRGDFNRSFVLRTAQVQPRLTVRTTPVSGAISYRAAAPSPLQGQLRVPPLPLAILAPLGQDWGFVPGTGTVAASLDFQGTPANLTGQLSLEGSGLAGRLKETPVTLNELAAVLTIDRQRGTQPTVTGKVRSAGGKWGQTPFDLAGGLTYDDKRLKLRDVTATLGQTRLTAATIDYLLSPPVVTGNRRRRPLHGTASGVSISGAAGPYLRAADIASRLELQQEGGRRWLEGTARLKAREWLLRQERQGPVQAVAECREPGTTVQFQGGALGGQLTGTAQFQPLAIANGVDFSAQLTTIDPIRLGPLLPPGQRHRFTAGTMTATAQGNYLPQSGLSSNFTLTGSDLALALPNGKTLLTGLGARMSGELSRDHLKLPTLQVTLGPALQLAATGELRQPFGKERSGHFTLSPSTAPIGAWLDAFANLLPRPMQEAVAEGSVSLAATVGLAAGQTHLDGSIGFQEGGLEIPSQKLHLSGVTGTIPLSLVTDTANALPPPKPRRERRDYPTLLADLRRPVPTGVPLRIETIAFGPLRIGPTTMRSQASGGLLEITRLESALFNGQLNGRGSLRLGSKLRYEADLLLNDLSLRLLCDAFPAITGYLSGRVDGLLGLLGDGPGVNNLAGSVELWTRSAPAEKMLISKEFLQKLAGKKLKGYFFRDDRPFDRGEIVALLQSGYLTFDTLDISHSTLGFRDLSVSVAAVQNRIALDHLLGAIKAAAARGKAATTNGPDAAPPIETEFKWAE